MKLNRILKKYINESTKPSEGIIRLFTDSIKKYKETFSSKAQGLTGKEGKDNTQMVNNDVKDLNKCLMLYKKGKYKEALDTMYSLDTLVRDYIPDAIYRDCEDRKQGINTETKPNIGLNKLFDQTIKKYKESFSSKAQGLTGKEGKNNTKTINTDVKDLKKCATLYSKGKYKETLDAMYSLDTFVRDYIPSAIWDDCREKTGEY